MKTKNQGNEDQLKIGEFIKDPMSLKLLILAGTSIRVPELHTISKCTGLIKLDLSNNYLPEIPLKFNVFHVMKILYLHDNQLSSVDIKKTNIQYVSLFGNLIQSKDYRSTLIEQNDKLLAIDNNIVTSYEKAHLGLRKLPIYSQLKWPIVQITNHLEHEEDYLNLLKAQIFVISNVYKRTLKIETIQAKFRSFIQQKNYQNLQDQNTEEGQIKKTCVIKAAKKWMEYTHLRKKLRAILAKKGKQHLIQSVLQRKRRQRGQGVGMIMESFLPMIRLKMKARAIFQRQVKAFRRSLPQQRRLLATLHLDQNTKLQQNPAKFYFKESQADVLSKVCLFAKKLLFQEKNYDLCDQFNNLFSQTSRKYLILRSCEYYKDERSWLMNSIHQTINFILTQEGIDRQHFLYTRRGHKSIKLKASKKMSQQELQQSKQKAERVDKKLNYIYQKYDRLLQYKVKNYKIMSMILKIIKYINAGNSSTIIQTQTAYFQTQIESPQQKQERVRIHVGLEFFTKRTIAANIIQKFWRRVSAKKKINFNTLQTIRFYRGQSIIKKWINNLIFSHRILRTKVASYQASNWKDAQVYFHLDIYMNMPEPTNFLRYQKLSSNKNMFYNLFHKNTQVQIVESGGRKWIKICYINTKYAYQAQQQLQKFTYRYYYNGFYLKFFNKWEINDQKILQDYETKIKHLFGFTIQVSDTKEKVSRNLWIQNSNPFFLWSEIQPEQTTKKFIENPRRNTTISIFIYNKHKRPLKVSCQFTWINPQSIYLHPLKTMVRKTPATTPKKKSISKIQDQLEQQFYMVHKRKRDKSLKSKRGSVGSAHQSLLKSHRTRVVSDLKLDMLSETLNIRKK